MNDELDFDSCFDPFPIGRVMTAFSVDWVVLYRPI